MSELLIVIGAIVSACGILLALLCVLTATLNIVLNKQLPLYKDLLEWVHHRRQFKEYLKKKNNERLKEKNNEHTTI